MKLSERVFLLLVLLACAVEPTGQPAAAEEPAPGSPGPPLLSLVQQYRQHLPDALAEYTSECLQVLQRLGQRLDTAAAELAELVPEDTLDTALERTETLLVAAQQLDQAATQVVEHRRLFAGIADPKRRKRQARLYLQIAGSVLDLQGRVRFHLLLGLDETAALAQRRDADRLRLVELLLKYQSPEGASVMALDLSDPPEPVPGVAPCSWETRQRILELVRMTREAEAFGHVLRLFRNPKAPPEIRLTALETLRELGIPQPPPPEADADPTMLLPAVTPDELLTELRRLPLRQMPFRLRLRRRRLLAWLQRRSRQGVSFQEGFRLGRIVVRPGDWLLIRNPSPYNLFTDLAPGLFTHVGVITWQRGSDGLGRMVVVDIPERGTRLPATNVETYVLRSLHYVVLRHPDAEVQARMAHVAREVIGNPFIFDLNFRTEKVKQLRGQPKHGRRIETYCAGLLLLCAQETGRPLTEFFPFTEKMAPGHTAANLAQLGIRLGRGFVSPTGAFFSPRLQLAARRRPLYDPLREIQQAVYNHFAWHLQHRRLTLQPSDVHQLRIRLAQAAKDNPALAALLARLHGVSPSMDLLSAARTAAVVEELDRIAYAQSSRYALAWAALVEPEEKPSESRQTRQRQQLLKQHAELAQAWRQGELSLHQLRRRLVQFYIQQGEREVRRQFFSAQQESGQ